MELTWEAVAALFLAVFGAELAMFGVSVGLRAITLRKAQKDYEQNFGDLLSAFESQFVETEDKKAP